MAAMLPTWRSGSRTTTSVRCPTAAASAVSFKHPPAKQPPSCGPLIESFTKYCDVRVVSELLSELLDTFLPTDVRTIQPGRPSQLQRLTDHLADEGQLTTRTDYFAVSRLKVFLLEFFLLSSRREEGRIRYHEVGTSVSRVRPTHSSSPAARSHLCPELGRLECDFFASEVWHEPGFRAKSQSRMLSSRRNRGRATCGQRSLRRLCITMVYTSKTDPGGRPYVFRKMSLAISKKFMRDGSRGIRKPVGKSQSRSRNLLNEALATSFWVSGSSQSTETQPPFPNVSLLEFGLPLFQRGLSQREQVQPECLERVLGMHLGRHGLNFADLAVGPLFILRSRVNHYQSWGTCRLTSTS